MGSQQPSFTVVVVVTFSSVANVNSITTQQHSHNTINNVDICFFAFFTLKHSKLLGVICAISHFFRQLNSNIPFFPPIDFFSANWEDRINIETVGKSSSSNIKVCMCRS